MKKLLLSAIVILGFSAVSFGQATAYAPTSATILAPITIVKNTNMVFGNVATNASGGTVVLATNSSRTATGGVTLPATATGTPSAADFTVGGDGNSTYAITLPTTLTITNSTGTGGETMTVTGFTSTPSGTGTLASGSQDLKVGATLNVGGSQVAGLYQNVIGFAVTVNYN
jgi:hypothetical protein